MRFYHLLCYYLWMLIEDWDGLLFRALRVEFAYVFLEMLVMFGLYFFEWEAVPFEEDFD